ncbi:MAG TPA: DciA family protein [Steroidobacteraceae bacterium]|jgi:hypothetical protein
MKPLHAGLGPLIKDLERRAQATLDLAAKVRQALPGPEKDHVVGANDRGDTLVVLADSAAWGSHIRYAQQELLLRLQAAGETQFTKVRVKVGRGEKGIADSG